MWGGVQIETLRLLPPDHYGELRTLLRSAPFKGEGFIVGNYAAPVAAFTGSWAYYDGKFAPVAPRLGEAGYSVDRDRTYLWLADRDRNPAYVYPTFYICMVPQTPGTVVHELARALGHHSRSIGCSRPTFDERDSSAVEHRVVARDEAGERRRGFAGWQIVRLDWDFPPFLRPLPGRHRDQPAALSASAGADGHVVDLRFDALQQDGRQIVASAVEWIAIESQMDCVPANAAGRVLSREDVVGSAGAYRVPIDFRGFLVAAVSPRTDTKVGMRQFSNVLRFDGGKPAGCTYDIRREKLSGFLASRPLPGVIELHWNSVLAADNYVLEMARDDGVLAEIGRPEAGTTVYRISDIADDADYMFRLRACRADSACSQPSDVVGAVAVGSMRANSMRGLAARRENLETVTLAWTPVNGALHYEIEMARNDDAFVPIGNAGRLFSTYRIGDLSPIDDYRFRMRACGEPKAGCTRLSDIAEALVPGSLRAISPAPLDVSRDGNTVELGWSEIAGATGYIVEMAESAEGAFRGIGVARSGTKAYRVGDLNGSTTYAFRIRACFADGRCSGYTEPGLAFPRN